MDFYALNYSLATLCLVAAVSFLLGRWSKADGPHRHAKPIGENRTAAPVAKRARADRAHASSSHSALSAEAEREIGHLLDRGHLIAAIKVVRRDLGLGLKEAKDLVDDLRRNM